MLLRHSLLAGGSKAVFEPWTVGRSEGFAF